MSKATHLDPGANRFAFVCGLHKSGTTLLRSLIARSEDVSSFRNTGAPGDEGQYLQTVMKPDIYLGELLFALSDSAFLDNRDVSATPEAAREVFTAWSAYWDLGKPLLLEKSPPNPTYHTD